MCRAIVILLLSLATQANTRELAAKHNINAQDKLIDRLMNKLVDKLLGLTLPQALPTALEPRAIPSFSWTPSRTRVSSMSSGWLPHMSRGIISASSSRSKLESDVRKSEVGIEGPLGRRAVLGTGTVLGLGLAMGERGASAAETFCGTAFPPATYGKYDPDACNKAVYTFQYPAGWVQDPLTKVEKGTKSIDGRVFKPADPNEKKPQLQKKSQNAFVVVLERAGEDGKAYELTDPQKTINSLAGTDYDLLDAVKGGDTETKVTERKGQKFFDYKITGGPFSYFVTVTVSDGRLFAIFVKATGNDFDAEESVFSDIAKSFALTGIDRSR